jgi:hypothetical protein
MELSPKAANQRQTTYIITGAASFALMYHFIAHYFCGNGLFIKFGEL